MLQGKKKTIFALAILLGVSACAYAFEYRRYAIRLQPATPDAPGYVGVLEKIQGPEDGSEDLLLRDCLASGDNGTPCIMVPLEEVTRIREDMIDLQRENARLKNRCR